MSDAQSEAVRRRVNHKVATAYDVASLAGVSQSAVSRTFTAGASVSNRTRERVLEAAKALNYRPNQVARSLSTSRSGVIGVAVSHLDNQFYPDFLERLSDALDLMGYRILLFVTKGSQDFEPVLGELLRYGVDALILASSSLSSDLGEQCRAAGVPVVMFNNTDPRSQVASVAGANETGGRAIADFLLAAGHQRFGFVAGVEGTSTSGEREAGFTQALREAGLDAPARQVGDYSFEGAWRASIALLGQDARPDAIFCANDHMALATLQAAQSQFGLTPGQDLSIIGFDNVTIGAWPCFQLTTYSQPMPLMVDRTVTQIWRLLDGKDDGGRHEEVSGELIVRASCRIPSTGLVQRPDGTMIWRAPDRP
jgi:DNA-binding LacI/PurR family transcriptional regulator